MTVREYLRFAARLKGVESRAVPAHVDELSSRVKKLWKGRKTENVSEEK